MGFRRAAGVCWDYLVGIRTRLLVINLVLVLVPVIGIEGARTYEREALRALELDMVHLAQALRTILESNLDQDGRPRTAVVSAALERTAQRTRMRIRILNPAGEVLADSHLRGAPEGPEPKVSRWFGATRPPVRRHAEDVGSTDPGPLTHRVEVRAARKGQLGTATRIHGRINRVFLFVTLPVMVKRRVLGIVYITRSTTPVLLSLHRLRQRLIQVLAVALGLTVLITLFLAATISRPLTRLTRVARRIAGGDRSVSLRLKRRDEIGQLARSFDSLVKQLGDRTRYISEFAANISHEFKTPLTSIRGAAELLADGAAEDPAARKRFLDNIQQDVHRLDRLVSRILELSRIEAEPEEKGPLDLQELTREIQEELSGRGEEEVVVTGPASLPMHGNRTHLKSAIKALVENAVRHNPDGAPVEIEAEGDAGGRIRVRVTDRGPGISPANQGKVFDRFFTTEAASGGTGLGLAIVEVVARTHGGTVALTSAPGQGCTFELSFPAGEKKLVVP